MIYSILFLLFLVVFVVVIHLLKSEPATYKYRRADFLTPSESKFFIALRDSVAGRASILAKVRLSDLAEPILRRNDKGYIGMFHHISSKHVDFLLCDFACRPLCAIELDDSSHNLPSRVSRDKSVDSVFADIGLPLFHVRAKASYVQADFKMLDTAYGPKVP